MICDRSIGSVHPVNHTTLDRVLAQLSEPGVGGVPDPADPSPEFSGPEAKGLEPLSLLSPQGDEVAGGGPRRGGAEKIRFLALAGLQFYYLEEHHWSILWKRSESN